MYWCTGGQGENLSASCGESCDTLTKSCAKNAKCAVQIVNSFLGLSAWSAYKSHTEECDAFRLPPYCRDEFNKATPCSYKSESGSCVETSQCTSGRSVPSADGAEGCERLPANVRCCVPTMTATMNSPGSGTTKQRQSSGSATAASSMRTTRTEVRRDSSGETFVVVFEEPEAANMDSVAPQASPNGLGAGLISAIVVGAIVALAIVAALVWFFAVRRRGRQSPHDDGGTAIAMIVEDDERKRMQRTYTTGRTAGAFSCNVCQMSFANQSDVEVHREKRHGRVVEDLPPPPPDIRPVRVPTVFRQDGPPSVPSPPSSPVPTRPVRVPTAFQGH